MDLLKYLKIVLRSTFQKAHSFSKEFSWTLLFLAKVTKTGVNSVVGVYFQLRINTLQQQDGAQFNSVAGLCVFNSSWTTVAQRNKI